MAIEVSAGMIPAYIVWLYGGDLQTNTIMPNPFMLDAFQDISIDEWNLLNGDNQLKRDWVNRGKEKQWLKDYFEALKELGGYDG